MPNPVVADVVMGFFTNLFKEMRQTPHTTLSTVFIWLALWVGVLTIYPKIVDAQTFVQQMKPQVDQLKSSMDTLNARLIKADYEKSIENMEEELRSTNAEIQRMIDGRMVIPQTMQDRVFRLTQELGRKRDELQRFTNANSNLLVPQL